MMMISRFMISATSTRESTPMISSLPEALQICANSPNSSLPNFTSSNTIASTRPKYTGAISQRLVNSTCSNELSTRFIALTSSLDRSDMAEPLEHGAHAHYGLLQHEFDVVEMDAVRARRAPRSVIDHRADRGVGQLELARQRRLGHAGHADDVASIALEAVDLGGALQARSLGARVDASIHRAVAGGADRREQATAQGL